MLIVVYSIKASRCIAIELDRMAFSIFRNEIVLLIIIAKGWNTVPAA